MGEEHYGHDGGAPEHDLLGAEFSRRSFLTKAGAAGIVLAGGGLAGALGASPASATIKRVAAATRGGGSVVGQLPKAVQQYYQLATTTPLGPSVYRGFKPKKSPPWLIGYASSFAGNSWRIGARTRMQNELIPTYKKAGLIKDVITLESNLVISTQIEQIRQLVDQGCDAIFTIGAAPTALNDAIKYAYDNGVLFVAQQGGVTSPYALQVSGNYALCGSLQATALGKKMGGKGNVLIVQGITQASASADFQRGHEHGLKAFKGIDIVGTVAGQWVDAVAKTQVLNFLATHPQPLGGIATQSPGDLGALSALMQTGRRVVPMTAGGELGPLAYWRDHPSWIDEVYQSWPPGDEMQECWEAMMRTLQGQGPKIASILIGPGPLTYKEVVKLIPHGTGYSDNNWVEPPATSWFPTKTMDMYFQHPKDPLHWRP